MSLLKWTKVPIEMAHVINIHHTGHQIDLEIGIYKVDVLGGWGVKLGRFSISLKHINTGQVVVCKKSFWPVQSFAFGKRAKRIFVVPIVQPGTYEIAFQHPTTLELTETNLFFTRFFQDPLPNHKISVYIH
jgi:hypothetical protein